MVLQRTGGRLGQERVGIPPEEVRGEGKREGQPVHAVGELYGGNLHIVLTPLRTPGKTQSCSEEAGETGGTLKWVS